MPPLWRENKAKDPDAAEFAKRSKEMSAIMVCLFFVLHGWVHLIYAGQSHRLYQLRPGMTWPDGSWFFAKSFGDSIARPMATIMLVLSALGFVAGAAGLFLNQDWWRLITTSASILSASIFILFWDGKFEAMDTKGWIGVLIDLVILASVLVLKLPA
jgi:hypothetical protein